MPILGHLVSLYESRGIGIATGLAPWRHANLPQTYATWFIRDGKSLTVGLGISLQEIYFLECLFADYRPRSIFIVGNSWGWGTLALALVNPQAKVVAIDAAYEEGMDEGIALTNRIAVEDKLNAKVIRATSPQDVAAVVAAEFGGSVDFAFIDGMHTNEQVFIDFDALRPHMAQDAVFLFHDVVEWKLADGVARAAQASGQPWFVLDGTSSGMGILFDPARRPDVARAIAPFRASDQAKAVIAQEVYRVTHRRSLRLKRSIAKRVRKLRRLFGAAPPGD